MAMLGEHDPAFQTALQAWRDDCARYGHEIEWRDAISFLRGWKGRGDLVAQIESALVAASPPLGFELRPDGNEDRESAAYVQGVGEVIAAVRNVLRATRGPAEAPTENSGQIRQG